MNNLFFKFVCIFDFVFSFSRFVFEFTVLKSGKVYYTSSEIRPLVPLVQTRNTISCTVSKFKLKKEKFCIKENKLKLSVKIENKQNRAV